MWCGGGGLCSPSLSLSLPPPFFFFFFGPPPPPPLSLPSPSLRPFRVSSPGSLALIPQPPTHTHRRSGRRQSIEKRLRRLAKSKTIPQDVRSPAKAHVTTHTSTPTNPHSHPPTHTPTPTHIHTATHPPTHTHTNRRSERRLSIEKRLRRLAKSKTMPQDVRAPAQALVSTHPPTI